MASTPPPSIGRVRLSEIADDWSRTQALNPRLLATELAGVLRTIAPDGKQLEGHHYSRAMFDLSAGAGGLTYWALADYFDSLGGERPSTSVHTTTGPAPASTVLLSRTFVEQIVRAATSRAATAAGFIVETLPTLPAIGGAARKTHQPEPPPGSSPEVLAAHQAQQRQVGEQSAAEQLEAARLAQQKAERAAEKEQSLADEARRQLAELRQENESLRQSLNVSARQLQAAQDDACNLEEQLEQGALFTEFLREENPLSPPEIRLAFSCWCALTRNSQHNPAGKGGRGVHGLVETWVKEQGLQLNKDQLSRLKATVNWHKQRGAIATQ